MSFVRDQCAIMSQLQIDMAREFASAPAECGTCNGVGLIGGWRSGEGYDAEPCPDCSPSPKPEPQDTDSQTLKGCGGFPFVSQNTGD